MGRFLYKMERKYGKYAIPNLSLILIVCYIIGYIITYIYPQVTQWLSLNPYKIIHGQVWRIVSWVLIPPGELSFWTIIMLYFYYSIGRSLESVWGDFRYNVYIFSGLIFTLIGAFTVFGLAYVKYADQLQQGVFTAEQLFDYAGYIENGSTVILPGYWFNSISTYYICMSIFLAYAAIFPEMQVLLFFIIPIKVKILGIIDAVYLGFEIIYRLTQGQWYISIIIFMSILNFVIFFLTTRNGVGRMRPSEFKRRADYQRKVRWAQVHTGNESTHNGKTVITKHKCAICGRTELDGDLEFRFCTKCDGNYEYCMDHLYTHEHVKRI